MPKLFVPKCAYVGVIVKHLLSIWKSGILVFGGQRMPMGLPPNRHWSPMGFPEWKYQTHVAIFSGLGEESALCDLSWEERA